MSKRVTSIQSVARGAEDSRALVVVSEEQESDGELQMMPIGEAPIAFSNKLTDKQILKLVKDTAKQIEKKADEAKALRERLNALLEKEEVKGIGA